MSVKDCPWCRVTWDEAVLMAKTFTAAPVVAIFHSAGTPLIRVMFGGGECVVQGTCLTSFSSISKKWPHKDLPLLLGAETESYSVPQICLVSGHQDFSQEAVFLDKTFSTFLVLKQSHTLKIKVEISA